MSKLFVKLDSIGEKLVNFLYFVSWYFITGYYHQSKLRLFAQPSLRLFPLTCQGKRRRQIPDIEFDFSKKKHLAVIID